MATVVKQQEVSFVVHARNLEFKLVSPTIWIISSPHTFVQTTCYQNKVPTMSSIFVKFPLTENMENMTNTSAALPPTKMTRIYFLPKFHKLKAA